MCGVAGILAPGWPAARIGSPLDRMVGTMVHRGPDSAGVFVENGIGLGMRRLSIIDLATGDQPMANEGGDVWVVQNGEIYNYRELRHRLEADGHVFRTQSDTEVLVHGWESWGEELVGHLNGMFAFAVWDGRSRRLFLARDRMGIKPLYWSRAENVLLFGSELKALLASGLVEPSLDEIAMGQYLVFEYVPAPRSIIRGVEKLEPSTWLSVADGEAPVLRKYWDLRFEPDRSGTREERQGRVLEAIDRAVRLELVSDVPVGVLLSGGVDSTSVSLGVTRVAEQPPQTFTIGFIDPTFDESADAREVARHLGTEHHEATLSPEEARGLLGKIAQILDEPLADSSLLPTYLLARFTREHVKVALGGDGGDELWAGYPTMLAHRLARVYRRLPRTLREHVIAPAVNRLPVSFENISLDFRAKRFVQGADLPPALQHQMWLGGYSPEGVRSVVDADLARELDDDVLFEPILRKLPATEEMEPWDRLLYLDARLYMEGDILTKVDRASMACSLEVRVPLLNLEVVDVARRVPFEWKLRGRRGKAILRDTIAPLVPPRASSRGKKGFNVPLSKWLRGPNREMLDVLVRDLSPVFRADAVRSIVDDHLASVADHRKMLWPLLVFHLWRDVWLTPRAREAVP